VATLEKTYPNARCSLDFTNPLELLVATILSAQCTDERVNKVTPDLFARFKTAGDYARASREDLENRVRTTGFFRNKAKSIQGAAQKMESDFGGRVPDTMEELLTLPGVARKTANVVLGNAYGKAEGVVVDTHVFRLAHRMGLSAGKNPVEVENDLMALVPKKDWVQAAHLFIHHGRAICRAIAPDCPMCPVSALCPQVGVAPPRAKKATKKTSTRVPLAERIAAGAKRRRKT